MIEHGFPTLSDFLESQQPDGQEILSKLQALHPKAIELLYELLKPPPPPAPSCLTHMDFWCNNLLFRKQRHAGDDGDNGNLLNGDNNLHDSSECLILDWQMMAVSRPTHDVALLMFTSLTPEIRQQHSERLLQYYWSVFQVSYERFTIMIMNIYLSTIQTLNNHHVILI
jgi:aminoglycoside phosphotransferase (APT) family kinase protein